MVLNLCTRCLLTYRVSRLVILLYAGPWFRKSNISIFQYFILSNLACNEEIDNKPNLTFIQSGPMTAVSAALSVGFQVSVQSLCFNISPKRANMSLFETKKMMFHFCKWWLLGTDESCWKKPTFIFWSIKGIFQVQYNLSSIASIYDRKSSLKNVFTVIHLEIWWFWFLNDMLKIISIALRIWISYPHEPNAKLSQPNNTKLH